MTRTRVLIIAIRQIRGTDVYVRVPCRESEILFRLISSSERGKNATNMRSARTNTAKVGKYERTQPIHLFGHFFTLATSADNADEFTLVRRVFVRNERILLAKQVKRCDFTGKSLCRT